MADGNRLPGLLKLMQKLGEPVEKTEEYNTTCPFCRHDYTRNEIRPTVKCLYCQGKETRAMMLAGLLDLAFMNEDLPIEQLRQIAERTRGYYQFEARRRLKAREKIQHHE